MPRVPVGLHASVDRSTPHSRGCADRPVPTLVAEGADVRIVTPIVACLALFLAAAGADIEERAKKLENMLMAPCCMTNTVAVHESGISHQMRSEIREMLAAGKNEREILDFYVARYGDQVLAMPEAKGFGLTPYLFPTLFVVIGSAFLILVFRQWHRKPAPEPAPAEQVAVAGPWAERLRKELKKLD